MPDLGYLQNYAFAKQNATLKPAVLRGVHSWHDASQESTVQRTGANVVRWDDIINSYNLSPPGNQPQFGNGHIGGLLGDIYWDGTSRPIINAAMGSLIAKPFTMIIVWKPSIVTGTHVVTSFDLSGSPQLVQYNDTAKIALDRDGAIGTSIVGDKRGSVIIQSCRFGVENGLFGFTGNTISNKVQTSNYNTWASDSANNFVVGAQYNGAYVFPFDGYVGEIVTWNRLLADYEIILEENRLYPKWEVNIA